MAQRLARALVEPIADHADLAARLAHLRELERSGITTEATQAAVIDAYRRKCEGRGK